MIEQGIEKGGDNMEIKSRKELEMEAAARARDQLETNSEVCIIHSHQSQTVEQLTRLMRFLAWARRNPDLNYTEQKGITALEEARKEVLQSLEKRNLAHLIECDAHQQEAKRTSWRIVSENFVALVDEKERSLSDHVAGLDTPTFLEILKETCPAMADSIVLTNWQEYLAKLAHCYDGQIFRYVLEGIDEENENVDFTLKYKPKA
jgi:hypothetical protein